MLVTCMFTLIVAVIPSQFDFGDQVWGAYVLAAIVGFGLAWCGWGIVPLTEYYTIIGVVPTAIATTGVIALASSKHERENHGQTGSDQQDF